MTGVTLVIPLVFWRISTFDSPGVTLKSTSGTTLPVFPSRTTNFGDTKNPLPNDVIPIDSKDARESILITWGKRTLGFRVLSDGYLNPISLIDMDFIDPISELKVSKIAPLPAEDITVVIPGKE